MFDYDKPRIGTKFPGPQHEALLASLQDYSNESSFVHRFIDPKKSKGNFLSDAEGNIMLDLATLGGTNPLGYNHDEILNARIERKFDQYLNQNANLAEFPPIELPDMIRETLMPVAPTGLTEVHLTSGTGTLANEAALKSAILKFKEERGDEIREYDGSDNFSFEEANVSVLSFQHSTHGKTIFALNSSESANGKITMKHFPVAPFPEI